MRHSHDNVIFAMCICMIAVIMWLVTPVKGQSVTVTSQPHPLVWVYDTCGDTVCVTDRLNRLSPERAMEAKVVYVPIVRTVGTWAAAPFYVYYRQ